MAAMSLWPTEPEMPLSLHRHHPGRRGEGQQRAATEGGSCSFEHQPA